MWLGYTYPRHILFDQYPIHQIGQSMTNYTTSTNGPGDFAAATRHKRAVSTMALAATGRLNRLVEAEDTGCTADYCFVCRRATEHFGEHSEAQLLAYYNRHWL